MQCFPSIIIIRNGHYVFYFSPYIDAPLHPSDWISNTNLLENSFTYHIAILINVQMLLYKNSKKTKFTS